MYALTKMKLLCYFLSGIASVQYVSMANVVIDHKLELIEADVVRRQPTLPVRPIDGKKKNVCEIFGLNNVSPGTHLIKHSGFYAFYLEQLPIFKIWNRWKVLQFLQDKLGQSIRDIIVKYDNSLPIYITHEYDKVYELKAFLESLECTVQIIEIALEVSMSD